MAYLINRQSPGNIACRFCLRNILEYILMLHLSRQKYEMIMSSLFLTEQTMQIAANGYAH